MDDLTKAQRRFLERVDTITIAPWTGAITALDQKGAKLRLGKSTFEMLLKNGFLIRSSTSLTTDTYVVHEAPVRAALEPDGAGGVI